MFSFDFDDLAPEAEETSAPKPFLTGEVHPRSSVGDPVLAVNTGYVRGEDAGLHNVSGQPKLHQASRSLASSQSSVVRQAAASQAAVSSPSSKPTDKTASQRRDVVSGNTIHLAPKPGKVPVRVASMFMLLPSTLRECPGVLHTHLWYHLLAPHGPQFSHVFVFVDKPMGATQRAAGADDAGSLLERWFTESAEAAALRPRVTLLDGSAAAALAAAQQNDSGSQQRRSPQKEAELRGCAAMNELCAKQVLNMERCIALARAQRIDWLICNLDVDEAFVCSGRAGECFGSVPDSLSEVQILNHEAVPETAEDAADYFRSCTLFKRCPYLLSSKKEGYMKFWSDRASAAGTKLAFTQLGDMRWKRGGGALELYFTGYSHGKAAVRVAACHSQAVLPLGPHRWDVAASATARAKTADACILHYNNCEGAAGLVRRYSGRKGESWNQLRMHTLCQCLYGSSPDSLASLFTDGLLITQDDMREVEAQVAAGVCLRIRTVQKACEDFRGSSGSCREERAS